MIVFKKILSLTAIMFSITVLFTFIGFHLGYSGLLLIGEIDLPYWLQWIIQNVLFALNMFVVLSFVLDMYNIKIFKTLAIYMIPHLALALFHCSVLNAFILPGLYTLVCAWLRKDLKQSFMRWLKISSFILCYELAASFVKLGYFHFNILNTTNFYQQLMFSIDLLIYMFLFYCIGGEKYVRLVVRRECALVLRVFPESVEDAALDQEDKAEIAEFDKLVGFKRLKAIMILLGFQVAQWVLILFICTLGQVLLEGIAITTSFIVYGFIVKKRWHSKSLVICTLSSAALFYVSAKSIPVYGYTQLFPIVVGLLLIYALYRAAIITDKYKEMENYISSLGQFELRRGCDRDELIRIAGLKGLTKRETELLECKYSKCYTQAQLEVKFSPWSLSSIKKYIKEAEERFFG